MTVYGITLEQAQAKLTLWMAAEESLAVSQSYSIDIEGNSRSLTRADLAEVAKRITYWQGKVVALSGAAAGQSRSRTVVN